MLIFLMMTMIISSILMNFIHPLMYILMLVIYTTMGLIIMYMMTSSSMYLYMIFISIIGGMMIMFLYFTSMINNYPSKIKMNELMMISYLMIISLVVLMVNIFYTSSSNVTLYLNNNFFSSSMFIYKIYMYPLSLITVITIMNLLYCLILTIKVSSSKYSPLRKINYEKI
uniref:NADH dehydrogenase subunit 6 n=1 Tax=Andrena bicolor TaxID=1190795 RepID=A0A0S2LTI5_ANDBI|nr:NADH dehydrogenase subunit 6 [Andrena bicolor]